MSIRSLSRAALALVAALALPACDSAEPSEFVNQSRIYTDFDLHYDANRDVTTARASFRFGGPNGTQLELSSPSRVEFNGQALGRVVQPVTNLTYYERTFTGQVSAGSFRFVDTEGASYDNPVTLRPIAFAGSVGPIDNDAAYELAWQGSALAADEEVGAVLFRIGQNTALGVFTQRDAGARSVILDRQQLQNVLPGAVSLSMERKVTRSPAEPTAVGGRVVARYTPVNATAQVVD